MHHGEGNAGILKRCESLLEIWADGFGWSMAVSDIAKVMVMMM